MGYALTFRHQPFLDFPEADVGLEKARVTQWESKGGTVAKIRKLIIFITYFLRSQETKGGAQAPDVPHPDPPMLTVVKI